MNKKLKKLDKAGSFVVRRLDGLLVSLFKDPACDKSGDKLSELPILD